MRHSRPPRDFQALQQRRRLAARLFAQGKLALASIARQLKASRQSVSRWYRRWQQDGAQAMQGAGRAGRMPRLSPRQLRSVAAALRKGASSHGFSADLWTLPRVAEVIKRMTGVKYHPGHVWKVLGAMNWTVQKPERQAKERSEEKVTYWKTVRWPEVKKTLSSSGLGSSSRMSPDSASNPRSAPRGRPGARRRS